MYKLTRTETRPSTDVPFFLQVASQAEKSALGVAIAVNSITTHEELSNGGLTRTATMIADSKEAFDAFLATPDLASYFTSRNQYNQDHSIDVTIVDEVLP